MEEIALLGHVLVVLLKKARKTHIYNNDRHMEGVSNSIKYQPDRKIDCDELTMYVHSRFRDLKESN